MGKLLKWGFLIGVAVFVCYHFYPHETSAAGKKLADKTMRAGKELAR